MLVNYNTYLTLLYGIKIPQVGYQTLTTNRNGVEKKCLPRVLLILKYSKYPNENTLKHSRMLFLTSTEITVPKEIIRSLK